MSQISIYKDTVRIYSFPFLHLVEIINILSPSSLISCTVTSWSLGVACIVLQNDIILIKAEQVDKSDVGGTTQSKLVIISNLTRHYK